MLGKLVASVATIVDRDHIGTKVAEHTNSVATPIKSAASEPIPQAGKEGEANHEDRDGTAVANVILVDERTCQEFIAANCKASILRVFSS